MPNFAFRSAKQLASLIRRKKVGCLELLDYYLERIERYNDRINAIIFTDIKAARKRAKAADRAVARGENRGPLHGVPMTVKESFDIVGMPTTWGVPARQDNYPTENAVVVDRLIQAGAIIFGKTNVPLNLADWQTFNQIYGTTNNPWDVSRVPGGSSGGSAAALAAGLTGLEAGSDIGASIRNPAHYCGVFGHKPTYNIVTTRGQEPPGVVAIEDISVVGPLARSAEDLALALDVIAGPDEIDGAGWRLQLPGPKKKLLGDFKLAVVYTDAEAEVDDAVQQRIRALVRCLRKNKVSVSEKARPAFDTREAHRNYIQLLRGATVSGLSAEEFAKNLRASKRLKKNAADYRAQMLRAQAMYHRDWHEHNESRHRMRLAWSDFFRKYDLLLCPVATTTAFAHNQQGQRWERMVTVNGKPQPSTTQLFWAGYSCNFYLPATVAPIGFAADGLPVGIQIVGPQYGDHTCIHFARLIEREFQGFLAPPGFE
ncbi:amidase [Alkalispirochaeta odontotermitis]|nr:amidase [Alkalispirochaeta odontotermitis]CAB1076928.1 Aspartyl-tRNA(Asn) amidotransferase subunit A (EC @ Glutamyl-tRNA(Gln) amidotransferase subunit A (EC [Olavius algarvensis Delta 1 endosymbiont]